MEMIWSPGPKSMSFEAVYPFCSPDGPGARLQYHATPNVHLVMTALNMTKRCHPIATLPLLAVILRSDVVQQQSQIKWAFNALCNAATVYRLLHRRFSHKVVQFENWAKLDAVSQKAVLEAMRTLQKTPWLEDTLRNETLSSLFIVDAQPLSGSRSWQWDQEYSTLLRIAGSFGLGPDEFEFYLTVPSSRSGKRVFYPFHVLSRPLAEATRWDWNDVLTLAGRMLHTMRIACNRHAEAAGLGDKYMNETRFVYWMVAHFSRQVQGLKSSHPDVSREEIQLRILDRWGLPIVPWIRNMLSASLCKGPDHGIAMKFGITVPPAFERFDPVRHINLDECTITIDTVATNMAMWNYQREGWASIRAALSTVPLRHSLWRIDEPAGQEIWGMATSLSNDAVAPVPDFDMPLVSIDAWFSDNPLRHRYDRCDLEFQNIGLLVEHCRSEHRISSAPQPLAPDASAEQDALDAAYWQEKLGCPEPGCDKTFVRCFDRDRHIRMHNQDKRFKCDWPGCDYATVDQGHLAVHKRQHVPDERYACDFPGCEHIASSAARLADHKNSHTGAKPWACDFPGCGKTYVSHTSLLKHKQLHDGRANYQCNLCSQVCTQAGNLRRHKDRHHPGWRDEDKRA